ncbi:hypothetical protein ACFLZ6_01340, partial [Nanoarchaeota archaeon]
MKKNIILFLTLFLIIVNIAYADGCCVNPNVDSQDICSVDLVEEDICCPDDSSFYAPENNGIGPADQSDCTDRFFDDGNACDAGAFIEECSAIGCCCSFNELGNVESSEITFEPDCAGNVVFDTGIVSPSECDDGCPQKTPLGCVPDAMCTTESYCPGTYNDDCDCVDVPDDNCPLDCDPATALRNLVAVPVKGEKWISLTWQDDCAPAVNYRIDRCVADECTPMFWETNSYIDNSAAVVWDQTYTYTVKAFYDTGAETPEPLPEVTASLGDIECWNQYTQEPFCVDSEGEFYNGLKLLHSEYTHPDYTLTPYIDNLNSAFACDNSNELSDYSIGGGDNYCPKGSCIVRDGVPMCTGALDCKIRIEQAAHPFGLYNNQDLCEIDPEDPTLPAYCFYDRSYTIVDDCYECSPLMGCYDYKSENACAQDNCGVGNCEWHTTYDGVDYIGVCVDTTASNCKWCDKHGTPGMGNLDVYNRVFDQCTQEKADALQIPDFDCFWTNGKAFSCDELVCTDYSSEDECEVSDPCGLGVCVWFDDEVCRKDADDDGIPDCGYGDNPVCDEDIYAPQTSFISVTETGIFEEAHIEIYDKTLSDGPYQLASGAGYNTFICVGEGCTPADDSHTNSSILMLTASPDGLFITDGDMDWQLQEGRNFIGYYSKDPYQNVEGIKYAEIWAYTTGVGPVVVDIYMTGGTPIDYFGIVGDRPIMGGEAQDYLWFTNERSPEITIEFWEKARVTQAGLTDSNGVPKAVDLDSEGATANITVSVTLSEEEYTLKLAKQNVKNDWNDVTMNNDLEVVFVVDITPPTIMNSSVNDGDRVNESNLTIIIAFDEAVKIESATLNDLEVNLTSL